MGVPLANSFSIIRIYCLFTVLNSNSAPGYHDDLHSMQGIVEHDNSARVMLDGSFHSEQQAHRRFALTINVDDNVAKLSAPAVLSQTFCLPKRKRVTQTSNFFGI
jgi:hypothetical protein